MKKLSIILVLLLVFLLTACATNSLQESAPETQPPTLSNPPTEAASLSSDNAQLINFRLIGSANSTGEQCITSEELEGIYDGEIYYYHSSDVLIKIDDTEMSLRDAILNQCISVEEFLAGLRTDARRGYCEETYGSYLGLTHFIYTYKQYDVIVYDDLWEAPNGESFLVREIWIQPGYLSEFDPTGIARKYQDENGNDISYRREDWGLTFEVVEVTPTSVRVNVIQRGGQQFGQLQADLKNVAIAAAEKGYLNTIHGTRAYAEVSPADGLITMNGNTEFIFDWSKDLGELPSGSYGVGFTVDDIYDAAQIHPFTKNYKDSDVYGFEFEIP